VYMIHCMLLINYPSCKAVDVGPALMHRLDIIQNHTSNRKSMQN
jgi:hypothetical protein